MDSRMHRAGRGGIQVPEAPATGGANSVRGPIRGRAPAKAVA